MNKKDYPYSKRVVVGIDKDTGRDVRKRIYATSERALSIKEYEAKRAWELAQEEQDFYVNSFGAFSKKWLRTTKAKRSVRTVNDYEQVLKKCSSLDNTLLGYIKKADLQEIINDNWDTPRTCRKISMTLKQIFAEAVEEDLIQKNPANNLTLPVYVKGEKAILSEEEKKALKEASLDDKERLFMHILFYCGLRPEEIRALQKRSVDLSNNVLIIDQAITWDGNAGVLKETKNHKDRNVPVPSALLPELKNYISPLKPSDWLFQKSNNELWGQSSFTRFVTGIFDKMNEKLDEDHKIVKNDLYKYRHNFCSNLYYEGVKPGKISILKAAEISGHTIEVFLQTYCHIDDTKEDLKMVIETLKL